MASVLLQYATFKAQLQAYGEARGGINLAYHTPPPDITEEQLAQGYQD